MQSTNITPIPAPVVVKEEVTPIYIKGYFFG
jgi:hypothetical protein